jgi:hypothetical protein
MAAARCKERHPLTLVRTAGDVPAVAGAYVLAIELADPLDVAVGGKKRWALPAGRYLCSANGAGGLKARIARHMRAASRCIGMWIA